MNKIDGLCMFCIFSSKTSSRFFNKQKKRLPKTGYCIQFGNQRFNTKWRQPNTSVVIISHYILKRIKISL